MNIDELLADERFEKADLGGKKTYLDRFYGQVTDGTPNDPQALEKDRILGGLSIKDQITKTESPNRKAFLTQKLGAYGAFHASAYGITDREELGKAQSEFYDKGMGSFNRLEEEMDREEDMGLALDVAGMRQTYFPLNEQGELVGWEQPVTKGKAGIAKAWEVATSKFKGDDGDRAKIEKGMRDLIERVGEDKAEEMIRTATKE
ncbi:unnamed protein product, partial [marine sediment metagenome]